MRSYRSVSLETEAIELILKGKETVPRNFSRSMSRCVIFVFSEYFRGLEMKEEEKENRQQMESRKRTPEELDSSFTI